MGQCWRGDAGLRGGEAGGRGGGQGGGQGRAGGGGGRRQRARATAHRSALLAAVPAQIDRPPWTGWLTALDCLPVCRGGGWQG